MTTAPDTSFTLNIRHGLRRFSRQQVMAILNATPDSFYCASRMGADPANHIKALIDAGADWLDVGACSTRPGSQPPTEEEEIRRLKEAFRHIDAVLASMEAKERPVVSVDTYRSKVAQIAVEELGADVVNDISGGQLDRRMISAVARMKVPYIIMHTRGTPAEMNSLTDYRDGVTAHVIRDLATIVNSCRQAGIADIIVDPGFGLPKTLDQNWKLLRELPALKKALGLPVLAGLSRKSMLTKPLGITADEALEATTAANTLALAAGADILRVHDPKAACQAVTLFNLMRQA